MDFPEPPHSPTTASADAHSTSVVDSYLPSEIPPPLNPTGDGGKSIPTIRNRKRKKKKIPVDGSDAPSSSATSACPTSYLVQRGIRVTSKQRNPRVFISSTRQKEGDVEALALPLGMSIAAVVAQVLERKDVSGETMAVNHVSKICTSAVRESLANVFGDKFDLFVRNFEKSFRSTLMTLRVVSESSQYTGEHHGCLNEESNHFDVIRPKSLNKERGFTCSFGGNGCPQEVLQDTIRSEENFSTLEDTEQNEETDSVNQELALQGGEINQQLACVSRQRMLSPNQSIFEKSVIEQTRSNDLKTFEIGLIVKKILLKEKQLALNSDLNFLERCKLSLGISKASFNANKFKTELKETRNAELLKKCVDCLVAGVVIMVASIIYGAYVYSHNRITEATASCTPSVEYSKSSWWNPLPMASFNSGLSILWCQVQVVSRMVFGLFMILAITYLLLQRSAISTQTMPVSFLLLLGVACGFAGKLCIDSLGGSGYHWLMHWEALCLVHFFANVWTSALFLLLHGPISVSPETNTKTVFPYWIRRFLFYATMLLLLPLLCGLMPFAGPAEWTGHFSSRVRDFFQTTSD